jgi:hypothetical protein
MESSKEFDETYVLRVIEETGLTKYHELNKFIQNKLERFPSDNERKCISTGLLAYFKQKADHQRLLDTYLDTPNENLSQILVVMAYSDDYSIGKLCAHANRLYAARHGHIFFCCVKSVPDIASDIHPKTHCSWYKIHVMRQLFANKVMLRESCIRYIMWIDADAIIIDFSVDIWRNIIERGCNKDLIIAEDMNPGCLLNSGVFLLRTTQWSADFLEEVWKSTKHDAVFFYEQSAMISMLKVKFEFFEDGTTPFHSYLPGADPGIKFMPHVAVFPHWELNTHRGIAKSDLVSKEHYLNVYSADRLDTGSLSCQTEASTTGRADYQQAAAAAGGDVFAWQSRDVLVDHLIVTSDRLDCDDGQRTAADSNTDNCEMIVQQQQGGGISINNRDIGLKEHSQKTHSSRL